MCIRDRYQRRVRGHVCVVMASPMAVPGTSPDCRSRNDSEGSQGRSLAGSEGRAIGTVQLVSQNASDLPTIETSAPYDSEHSTGVQIVVTGPDNIARSVVFERTDRLANAFEIMQQAGLIPAEALPWAHEQKAQRMSDEFMFDQNPSAFISSSELLPDTRGSGEIAIQAIRENDRLQNSAFDMRRMSGELMDVAAGSGIPTGRWPGGQMPMNTVPAESIPPDFLAGMSAAHERHSDGRDSERISSMDPTVLGTLLQHSEAVSQQAAAVNPHKVVRTDTDLMLDMLDQHLMQEVQLNYPATD
eukprot:TRINITY_DN646_c0_g1_i3.p1 TRINITY_DN646_c0_g1~~TRINITY_DN646_c0_g1_i3.p1  ORF type:complete len:301 (+),score=54.27 TRINITY_DN646_c0_g1_i3:186-1088(+)